MMKKDITKYNQLVNVNHRFALNMCRFGTVEEEAGTRYGRRYVWVRHKAADGCEWRTAFWDHVLEPA